MKPYHRPSASFQFDYWPRFEEKPYTRRPRAKKNPRTFPGRRTRRLIHQLKLKQER